MSTPRHDRLYEEACKSINGLILLHDRPEVELKKNERRRLEQAVSLFEEVLRINPTNWSAMWLLGKVHQRFDNTIQALKYFTDAHIVNPDQPDVAREASLAAMDLHLPEKAVSYCERAIHSNPTDPGLKANLALALLFSNRPDEAIDVARTALLANPSDEITRRIVDLIQEVLDGNRPCPRHVRDLD